MFFWGGGGCNLLFGVDWQWWRCHVVPTYLHTYQPRMCHPSVLVTSTWLPSARFQCHRRHRLGLQYLPFFFWYRHKIWSTFFCYWLLSYFFRQSNLPSRDRAQRMDKLPSGLLSGISNVGDVFIKGLRRTNDRWCWCCCWWWRHVFSCPTTEWRRMYCLS